MHRKKPSRMALSEKVATPTSGLTARGRQSAGRGAGPFGAMNTTRAPRHLKPINYDQPYLEQSRRSGDDKHRKKNDETFHALKMQRALSSVSYPHRNAIKDEISDIDSFQKLELLAPVREAIAPQALAGQEDASPTPIQRVAIPALMGLSTGWQKRKSPPGKRQGAQQFLLAAETGSGKTLAYLLPIIDAIKRTEAKEDEEEAKSREQNEIKKRNDPYFVEPPPLDDRVHPTSGRPRAIILLPTSELVHQVAQLVRSMAYKVKIRSKGISATDPPHTIRRRVFAEEGIDILVSTPHLLQAISASDPNILSRVRHLVIDEADSLMDRSFSRVVQPIIDKSESAVQQLIFCSATIPRSLDTHLRSKYPDLRRLVTPSLHAIPRRVQLSVVDIEKIPYQGNRNLACADAIYNINKLKHDPVPGQPETFNINRVLVFVNEREQTTELAEYLQRKGIDAVAFNRDAEDERDSEVLKDFTARPPHMSAQADSSITASKEYEENPSEDETSPEEPAPTKLGIQKGQSYRAPRLENVKVIVATDLLSRGVDTLSVRQVILHDVPHSVTDFIHRLGRVGRMKMRGRGIVLVGKHDRSDIVREVREAMFRGQALI